MEKDLLYNQTAACLRCGLEKQVNYPGDCRDCDPYAGEVGECSECSRECYLNSTDRCNACSNGLQPQGKAKSQQRG